ncbi:pilus assembly protein [Hydrogenophaga sp.]|uniref:pilus assembly protein n=1 Tax=Hydrogenophaga sp. TaxID=1904254 RepID=UPI003F6D25CE
MYVQYRLKAAIKAAFLHLIGSVLVATLAAILVFVVWYPPPYDQLSGGLKLFLVLVGVDVVCGPLLTLVLFDPNKSKRELIIDMLLVIAIQLTALGLGLNTAYQARPLFLVHEVDRFRVITSLDYGDVDVREVFDLLNPELRPQWMKRPVTVGIRDPITLIERQDVMLESAFGGRDYSQRPEFYIPYDFGYRPKAMARAKPLQDFVKQFPSKSGEVIKLLSKHDVAINDAVFLPVLHKQEWIAILDPSAKIIGFVAGDGFEVPEKSASDFN